MNIERLIKKLRVKTNAATEERILRDALKIVAESRSRVHIEEQAGIWQKIMRNRAAQLVSVAAVITVALIVIQYSGKTSNGSSVVWADVAAKVKQIETFSYRQKTVTTECAKEGIFRTKKPRQYSLLHKSSKYGASLDLYVGKNIVTRMLMLPGEKSIIEIIPAEKKYFYTYLTEERIKKKRQESDPRELVGKVMSLEFIELGRDTIDGIETEVIEVNDPRVGRGFIENSVGRLWVNRKTYLPVRMEIEGVTADGTMRMTMVMDEFRWDQEFGGSELLADIPEDYTLGEPLVMPDINEKSAIQGLAEFAEIASGRYPSTLFSMMALKEAGDAWQITYGYCDSSSEYEKYMKINTACEFYFELVNNNEDVAYYGDKVTAKDTDAVLLRWRVSGNEYRVIFGDLRAETVTDERLAELEKAQQKQAVE